MPLSNLRIFFDGLEEATPGMPCYDPEQPWFAHVTVVNANVDTKHDPSLRPFDPQKPTAAAGPFKVSFQVFPGSTASSASGSTPFTLFEVDGLGAYPGPVACAKGFSMQLPKNITKADFGIKHGFRFYADPYFAIPESNVDDNIFLWENGQAPSMAPQWSEGDPSPFSNLKFMGFRAVAGSKRDIEVLVKNQGSETSFQLELRLNIMGPPTPRSPLGSALESVSVNSTAIPTGGSVWVRFTAKRDFVQPRTGLPARELRRLQAANPGSRRFRQVQMGNSSVAGGLDIPRYLVMEKDFDFMPLKPFTIAVMNSSSSEKVAFGESPVGGGGKKPGGGGPIAIPHK